ncbi:DUF6221 family protein [Streptomyces sp. NPDC058319]|uniref:DUF6221 family protein n=1 Tax=unclassified Streptomyces TaxID=2593676 RepID=UPI0036E06A40
MDIVQKFGEDVAVPNSPESEGSRLITLKQIEQEHGVSRSALHTYRRSASFPQPVPVEGSTRIQYRADEVASWFEANPPQQGKRTDLATQDEGVPVEATRVPVPPGVELEEAHEFVRWLRAQFDADEQIARAAARQRGGGEWDADADPEHRIAVVGRYRPAEPDYPDRPVVLDPDANETAVHIACHDPARVLREIDAKRRILDLYATAVEERSALRTRMREVLRAESDEFGQLHLEESGLIETARRLTPVVRLLALPYADQPGYREEWRL